MPNPASDISGVKTWNYEVETPEPRILRWELAGFDGYIENPLNVRPVVITETGWTSTAIAMLQALFKDRGKSNLTTTLNTKGKGIYTNVYLWDARLTGRSRGDGTKAMEVEYRRIWQQIICGADIENPPSADVYGSFSITDFNTSVVIPVIGLTATGQVYITLIAPTGNPGDTIFTETYTDNQVTVSVDSPPGFGQAFNGLWYLGRLT